MSTEIFLPMSYMLILTSAVFLFNTIIRFKDVLIDKGHRGSELYGLSLPSSASNITKQGDRNLVNLFEFPIFFYIICISIYVTGKVDDYFVLLAYWFLGFRILHSIYHIFINGFLGALPIRALFFVPSWAVVVWMWFRFIQMIWCLEKQNKEDTRVSPFESRIKGSSYLYLLNKEFESLLQILKKLKWCLILKNKASKE